MRSEANALKNGQPTAGFSFTTMLQDTLSFSQGFLSTEQCDNTGASPILYWPGSSWYLTRPLTKISIGGMALLWSYWHKYECDRRAEKAFTKWFPGMFPTPLRLLAEVYRCARGSFWSYHICAVTWLIDIHISVIYATTSRSTVPKFTRQYFTHTYLSIVLKLLFCADIS